MQGGVVFSRIREIHDVDAGKLKRVVVADGAVVRIQGPREVSLIGTLQLPLPLGSSLTPSPGGLLGLATRLREAARAQDRPIVSLRVVGPTSLVAVPPQGIQDAAAGRLKVRRLAPGAVELVSRQASTPDDVEEEEEEWGTELSEIWVWPLPQLRGSDPRLAGVESAFRDVLGSEAYKKGYFRLTKAKASVVTLMQVRFEVGRQNASDAETTGMAEGDIVGESDMEKKMVWEATVKIDGQRVQPLNARPIESHVTVPPQPLHSNWTRLGAGNLALLGSMALDVNWGYYGL
ncbi:hypothetical protein CBR_g70723 [Chara braunii]|uniref:Uncharacterized protein n=1 Tax=Chara braunii TaxID=69332 RepID=A0A388K9Z4_CHABU|nr:hypothetical protein CBR_g70723 [Chara braunii]|eukprot:GBG66846.1 hypothetical protein CBR_g70723 [Chara braunii]